MLAAGGIVLIQRRGQHSSPAATNCRVSHEGKVFDSIDIHAHTIPADWQTLIKTKGPNDLHVVDNKLAAETATTTAGTTGWHSHPGPSLIQVVAGTVTNYEGDDPSCTPHIYTAGTGFVDAGGNDVHMLVNEGSVPAETIAVQLLPQDAVRRVDAPDPGNCPH